MHKYSIIMISAYALITVVSALVGLLYVPFSYSGPKDVHPDLTVTNWLTFAGIGVLVAGSLFTRFSQHPARSDLVAVVVVWILRAWILALIVAFFSYALLSADHWNAVFFRGQGTGWLLIGAGAELYILTKRLTLRWSQR